jgi:YVTN family beta-propeller protein
MSPHQGAHSSVSEDELRRRRLRIVAGMILGIATLVAVVQVTREQTRPHADHDPPATAARTAPAGGHDVPAQALGHDQGCAPVTDPLPGMPPVTDPCNIYAADGAGDLSPVVRGDRPLVYVPDSLNDTVDEIDPTTFQIVRQFQVDALPQHIVPSWDLKTLWVTNDQGNTLTPINPVTGVPGPPVPVEDPYNMYFTPNGRYAIVVAEAMQRLDFRNPQTMALVHSLPVPCRGVDHMDFSANGRYLIASCEFSGSLLKVDVERQAVVGVLSLRPGSEPQDVKLSPDGRIFYVADLTANGVWEVDGDSMRVVGFIPTGLGAHGLYVSRNAQDLYVSNRGSGTVSVISFAARKVVATWTLPPDDSPAASRGNTIASPDMGDVSADGKVLWLSGRYDSDVYAIDTATGKLLARIPVGDGPHGLCVWPEPGRYSLGHTGIMR